MRSIARLRRGPREFKQRCDTKIKRNLRIQSTNDVLDLRTSSSVFHKTTVERLGNIERVSCEIKITRREPRFDFCKSRVELRFVGLRRFDRFDFPDFRFANALREFLRTATLAKYHIDLRDLDTNALLLPVEPLGQ